MNNQSKYLPVGSFERDTVEDNWALEVRGRNGSVQRAATRSSNPQRSEMAPGLWLLGGKRLGVLLLAGMVVAVEVVVTWNLSFAGLRFGLVLAAAAMVIVYGKQALLGFPPRSQEARQLGQYRLIKRLGVGGMGEVYLAEHSMLQRPCAIKLIRPDHAGDKRILARFEREVQTTARLSHWNTVEVFDYGRTEDGTLFYVMEYLPGLNVEELLQQHGPQPVERVIHILRQACQGLREAHAEGLIHRDLKPANLFIAHRGGLYDVVKLLDFGLVKSPVEGTSPQLTLEGAISGTPHFMSPEQARGLTEIDARSDIYSLGAVGYALLCGRPPFEGSTPMEVIMAHIRQEVIPASRFRTDVPEELESIILRCLAKRPEDRFPDAECLDQALTECEATSRWTQADAARCWRVEVAQSLQPEPQADGVHQNLELEYVVSA